MSSVLVSPTTDSDNDTETQRVVSINPCRRQGAAAAARCVHCTCQLSLRLPQLWLLVMDAHA